MDIESSCSSMMLNESCSMYPVEIEDTQITNELTQYVKIIKKPTILDVHNNNSADTANNNQDKNDTQTNNKLATINKRINAQRLPEYTLHLCDTSSQFSRCEDIPISAKQTEYKPLVLCQQIFPRYSFQIYGDIMVHTDIKSMGEFVRTCSPINLEKRIIQIAYNKSKRFVEISFEETNTTFIEFDNFIHIFSEYPDQTLHRFGVNLMKYKKYAMKQMKMIDIFKKQENYQLFCQLKNVKYHRFKKATEELFDTCEDRYICYFYYKRNYQTGGVEMEKMGINEKLLSLLGTNPCDYEEMARRIGIYSFQSKYSYNFLFNQYLEIMGSYLRKSASQTINPGIFKVGTLTYSSQMLTFDDIILETTNTVETYIDLSDEDSDLSNNLLKFRDLLHVYSLTISENSLQMINHYRQHEGKSMVKQDDMLLQKSSLQYELEASVFLEKFYSRKKQSDKEKKIEEERQEIDRQKMCGYKNVVIDEEK